MWIDNGRKEQRDGGKETNLFTCPKNNTLPSATTLLMTPW